MSQPYLMIHTYINDVLDLLWSSSTLFVSTPFTATAYAVMNACSPYGTDHLNSIFSVEHPCAEGSRSVGNCRSIPCFTSFKKRERMARLYRAFLAQYIPVSILSIAAAFLCYFYVYLPKDVKLLAGIVVTIITISFILQVLQIVLWFIDRKSKTDYSVKVLRNLTIFCSGSILFGALPVLSILYFGFNGPVLTYTIVVSNISVIHLGVLLLNANFIRYIIQKHNCDRSSYKMEYKAGFQLVGLIVMLEFFVLLFVYRVPHDIWFIPLAHGFYGCLWIVPNSFMLGMLLCDQVVVDDMLVCCQRFLTVIKSAEEECFLCMEDYNQTDRTPQVLATCGHTMCKRCLTKMKSMAAANYQSGNTKCPFCRTGYPLNETAVETYRHKRILDKIRKQDRWKARKAWISSCFDV